MSKVKVDQNVCIGCGMCAGTCPDIFQMNLNGKSEVIKEEADDCAKNAAGMCPVDAIKVE